MAFQLPVDVPILHGFRSTKAGKVKMIGLRHTVVCIGVALFGANLLVAGCSSSSSDAAREDASAEASVDASAEASVDALAADHGQDSTPDTATPAPDLADSGPGQPDLVADAGSPDASTSCGSITSEGCCDGRFLKYCSILENVRTIDCNVNPSCGWNETDGTYTCGTSGGADPSGTYPLACP